MLEEVGLNQSPSQQFVYCNKEEQPFEIAKPSKNDDMITKL